MAAVPLFPVWKKVRPIQWDWERQIGIFTLFFFFCSKGMRHEYAFLYLGVGLVAASSCFEEELYTVLTLIKTNF